MAITREKILEIARSLPPGPQVFSELDGLLRDENSGLDQIAALIKRDATLAAQIIRVSNSVAYGGEQRTGSVEDAVGRVGLEGELFAHKRRVQHVLPQLVHLDPVISQRPIRQLGGRRLANDAKHFLQSPRLISRPSCELTKTWSSPPPPASLATRRRRRIFRRKSF